MLEGIVIYLGLSGLGWFGGVFLLWCWLGHVLSGGEQERGKFAVHVDLLHKQQNMGEGRLGVTPLLGLMGYMRTLLTFTTLGSNGYMETFLTLFIFSTNPFTNT